MRESERGNALLLTLIILSLLVISGLSLVTSTQSTTIIAGNMAFKSNASSTADVGITLAQTTLGTISNLDTSIANQYFATQQPVNSNNIPTTVNWANVSSTTIQNYSLQYVIERLCTGSLPVSNTSTQCTTAPSAQASSKKLGGGQYSLPTIYYRVTARVVGPKNATSYIQAILQR